MRFFVYMQIIMSQYWSNFYSCNFDVIVTQNFDLPHCGASENDAKLFIVFQTHKLLHNNAYLPNFQSNFEVNIVLLKLENFWWSWWFFILPTKCHWRQRLVFSECFWSKFKREVYFSLPLTFSIQYLSILKG